MRNGVKVDFSSETQTQTLPWPRVPTPDLHGNTPASPDTCGATPSSAQGLQCGSASSPIWETACSKNSW